MNRLLAAALAAGVVAFSQPAARAQAVDMSTITCGMLLSMTDDEASFTIVWLAGYMAGLEEELSMDPEQLGLGVAATVAYCAENQEMSVLNAAMEAAEAAE